MPVVCVRFMYSTVLSYAVVRQLSITDGGGVMVTKLIVSLPLFA